MSVQDDLARNRRIFEILTGEDRNRDSVRQTESKSRLTVPESTAVSAREQGFSLKNGTVDLPAGFSELPGIGSVTYPEIKTETAYSAPKRIDLINPEQSRMEAEARMDSQLSREEGFFGF